MDILEALAPCPGCEEQLADLRLVRHCFVQVGFLLFAVRARGDPAQLADGRKLLGFPERTASR